MLNSVSQVALKWLVQQNITVVTAADNPVYIQQDLDLYAPGLASEQQRGGVVTLRLCAMRLDCTP